MPYPPAVLCRRCRAPFSRGAIDAHERWCVVTDGNPVRQLKALMPGFQSTPALDRLEAYCDEQVSKEDDA